MYRNLASGTTRRRRDGKSLNGRLFNCSHCHFRTLHRCCFSIGRPPHAFIRIAHSRANESFLPRVSCSNGYGDPRTSPDFWSATSHWTPPFVACWASVFYVHLDAFLTCVARLVLVPEERIVTPLVPHFIHAAFERIPGPQV
jgi:hypothetical protein